MSRLQPLPFAALTDRQRAIHAIISRAPTEHVHGPIRALLLSPDLAETAQHYGKYIRYESSLGLRLVELATLVAARHWNCEYVWQAHETRAIKAGVPAAVAEAIRVRAEPVFAQQDEAIVYAFAREMVANFRVSSAAYDPAARAFGEAGVAELIGLLAYLGLLAMTVNGFELDAPDAARLPA